MLVELSSRLLNGDYIRVWGLDSLKGVIYESLSGSMIGRIKGDTRSSDYSSLDILLVLVTVVVHHPSAPFCHHPQAAGVLLRNLV